MLNKKNRLQKDRDFRRVYQKGKVASDSGFIIRYLANKHNNTRIGIVISKKISNKATVRNRLKRQILAVLESILCEFNGSYDVVIGLRKIPNSDFNYITSKLISLCKNENLI